MTGNNSRIKTSVYVTINNGQNNETGFNWEGHDHNFISFCDKPLLASFNRQIGFVLNYSNSMYENKKQTTSFGTTIGLVCPSPVNNDIG